MKKLLSSSLVIISSIGNIILFFLIFTIIFLVPIFPLGWHNTLFSFLFTFLYFVTVMVLDRYWKIMLTIATLLTVIEWLASTLDLIYLTALSRLLIILFFNVVVVYLILQIARTKKVSLQVILSSINGYLLLGFAFSLLMGIVHILNPQAFNFPEIEGNSVTYISNYIYFGFVTFTTLGYGDISPQIPIAKSLATLTSVSGQIYVAVIIAMLVGKYAGGANQE